MIELQEVTKLYQREEKPVRALDGVSLRIEDKEFVSLTGPSGCGKSTLLHLVAGLDQPTEGKLRVAGIDLHSADEPTLTQYRRHKLGIVFQFFNLLPTMTVLENVSLPLLLQGQSPAKAEEPARDLLELVEMDHRTDHFMHQLSGGEMQRTAIARALVHKPQLLLADEPTGNLDSHAASRVMQVIERIAEQKLATIILVSHSQEIAATAQRQVKMRDGKVVEESTT